MLDLVALAIKDGWTSARRDDYPVTLEYFQALRSEHPEDPRTQYALACALDYSGLEAGAAEEYERCDWSALPDDDRRGGRVQYASTLRNLGRHDEALAVLRVVRQEHRLDGAAAVFTALTLVDLGNAAAGVAELANHLLDVSDDQRLLRYEWALRRYIGAIGTSPS
ncbi:MULTISPECIES: tetratricopeptide repeat protein [Amycolatopsis]|uniref:Tetratricopeptide repeat protein n=1 Tax=Amycolatopsis albidoflavus TaxID=102226 RepID=A0ABW5I4L9_9PSEU